MKRLVVTLIWLGGVFGAFGQQAMSLEECRQLAVENNKKLKVADEQIKSAKARRQEAFTKYLPGVDAMGHICVIRRKLICFRKMPVCR